MISRWDPFRDLAEIQDRINQVFGERMTRRRDGEPVSTRTWEPPVNIWEDQDQLVVRADLPGLTKDEIEIQVTDEALVISGERKFEDVAGRNYVRVERTYGPFQRSFSIGIPVRAGEVKASYKDGVLEIVVPKAEEIKPKKVQVEVE